MPIELAQHSGLGDLYRVGETLGPVDADDVADTSDSIPVVGVEAVRQDSTPPDEISPGLVGSTSRMSPMVMPFNAAIGVG